MTRHKLPRNLLPTIPLLYNCAFRVGRTCFYYVYGHHLHQQRPWKKGTRWRLRFFRRLFPFQAK